MRRLLFFCLLALTACQTDDEDLMIPQPQPMGGPAFNYLALGDSYTIGTAVDPAERWPCLLLNRLEPAIDVSSGTARLDVVAVNGWTTTALLEGIDVRRPDLRESYDLVSLLIGVNNQFRGRPLAAYRLEFEELLQTAIAFADDRPGRVFVVSIPDYSYTPFGGDNRQISRELAAFNAAAREIATDYGVVFLNITPISEEGLEKPELVASDGLHPSGVQYRRWVEEVIFAPVAELLR